MMPDGAEMDWTTGKAVECVSLNDAIARLQAGDFLPGMSVDLGDGAIAEFSEADTPDAFLTRLLGHVRLMSLAETADQSSSSGAENTSVSVDSHAKALLDAVKNAR